MASNILVLPHGRHKFACKLVEPIRVGLDHIDTISKEFDIGSKHVILLSAVTSYTLGSNSIREHHRWCKEVLSREVNIVVYSITINGAGIPETHFQCPAKSYILDIENQILDYWESLAGERSNV